MYLCKTVFIISVVCSKLGYNKWWVEEWPPERDDHDSTRLGLDLFYIIAFAQWKNVLSEFRLASQVHIYSQCVLSERHPIYEHLLTYIKIAQFVYSPWRAENLVVENCSCNPAVQIPGVFRGCGMQLRMWLEHVSRRRCPSRFLVSARRRYLVLSRWVAHVYSTPRADCYSPPR